MVPLPSHVAAAARSYPRAHGTDRPRRGDRSRVDHGHASHHVVVFDVSRRNEPSDLTIVPAGGLSGYSAQLAEKIGRLPHVEHVESYVALRASLIHTGRTPSNSLDASVIMVGSVNGLLFNQDRFSVTAGRTADPTRADEVMVTEAAAATLGLRLGQTITVGLAPTARSGAERRLQLHVVGIGLLNREVVEDQIARFPTYIVATPALTRSALGDAALSYYGVQLRGGARFVPDVERAFTASERYFTDFEVASQLEAQAEQSIRPEALALGVFGAIAGLAALLLAIQAIARQLGAREQDLGVLRAIGASPAMTTLDGLIGMVGSIVLGSAVAVGAAIGISPLAPVGPVRPVYPGRGGNLDWTVLGAGFALLVGVLGTAAVVIGFLSSPRRGLQGREDEARRSATVDVLARSRFPVSVVAGARRFALERGRGRTAAPTRLALLGGVVAMIVVAATLTFGSSLHTLVSEPRLYGWNWDYAVQSSDGYGPVPNQAVAALKSERSVVATSGVWFATLQLDGVEVPVLIADPNARVSPPIVEGHGVTAPNQIVLGATTLAQLHKRLGEVVDMRYVAQYPPRAIRLVIVGVATMPAIGIAESLHTSMAIGAIVPADNGTLTERLGPQAYPGCNGPNMVFLRVRGRGRIPERARRGRAARSLRQRHPVRRTPELELRWQRGDGALGATSGADRELPDDGDDTAPARGGTRFRSGRGARPRTHRVGAASSSGSGAVEDPRVHAATVGVGHRLAGVDRRTRGNRGRYSPRCRARALALDPLRRRDRRGAVAHGACLVGGPRRTRCRSFWRTSWRHSPGAPRPAPRLRWCCTRSSPRGLVEGIQALSAESGSRGLIGVFSSTRGVTSRPYGEERTAASDPGPHAGSASGAKAVFGDDRLVIGTKSSRKRSTALASSGRAKRNPWPVSTCSA